MSRRAWDALTRRDRAIQRGQAATGVKKGRLFGDLTEEGIPLLTVLSFSSFGSFVATGHFGLVASFASRTNLN